MTCTRSPARARPMSHLVFRISSLPWQSTFSTQAPAGYCQHGGFGSASRTGTPAANRGLHASASWGLGSYAPSGNCPAIAAAAGLPGRAASRAALESAMKALYLALGLRMSDAAEVQAYAVISLPSTRRSLRAPSPDNANASRPPALPPLTRSAADYAAAFGCARRWLRLRRCDSAPPIAGRWDGKSQTPGINCSRSALGATPPPQTAPAVPSRPSSSTASSFTPPRCLLARSVKDV